MPTRNSWRVRPQRDGCLWTYAPFGVTCTHCDCAITKGQYYYPTIAGFILCRDCFWTTAEERSARMKTSVH